MILPLPRLQVKDLMTGFGFLKDILPEESKTAAGKALQSAFVDWLSKTDEAILMGLKAFIHEKDSAKLTEWFKTKYEGKNIGHVFRKFVTAHDNEETRIQILLSYASMEDNDARTARLMAETVPPAFIEDLVEFFLGKGLVTEIGKRADKLEKELEDAKDEKERKMNATENPFKKFWYIHFT